MKLVILTDNNTLINDYYLGEPGLSIYMEDGESRLLLDTGYSDVFLRNADSLGIDLSKLDTLVLSHGHDDHTRGLIPLLKKIDCHGKRLIAHPAALQYKRSKRDDCGPPYDTYYLGKIFKLQLTQEPYKISEHLTFLGEIPQYVDFEPRKRFGERLEGNKWLPDYIIEDSALVYENKTGISIITGCSHSGICNIIEHTKHIFKTDRIENVIGGFHLREDDERTKETATYLSTANIKELYPCHCVSFDCKARIHALHKIHEVGVGTTFYL